MEWLIIPTAFSVCVCFIGNGIYFLLLGFFPYKFKHIKEETNITIIREIKQPLTKPIK